MSAAPVPRKIFAVAQRAELRPWGLFRRLRGGDAGLHASRPAGGAVLRAWPYRPLSWLRAGGGRACHPIARACSMPFTFGDGLRGCTELPDGGWDPVIRWAHDDRLAGAI